MESVFVKTGQIYRPLPVRVHSFGRFSNAVDIARFATAASGTASGAWPANNRALYAPLQMPSPFLVARFMFYNSTSLSGTVDMGLYDSVGNRLLSTGATARSGASAVQYVGVADQLFPAGHYYVAMLATSTTGNFIFVNISSAAIMQAAGMLQEDVGAATLPTTMTPSPYTVVGTFCFGFTQSDTL